jgi:two-component system NarL family sensor kinase
MQQSGYIVTLLVIISTLLLGLLSIFVLLVLQNHRKKNILHRSELNSILHSKQKDILDAQLKVQEQTFKSISAEIHDNIGQRLTLAKLQLNIVLESPKIYEGIKPGIQDAVRTLTDCIADLRDLSRNLSYERIGILGFQELIQADLKQLDAVHPIACHYSRNGELYFLGVEIELVIYRIFQEIIQNTLKHAAAKNFFVRLDYHQHHLDILFEDDGVGFEANGMNMPNGLNNLQARAKSINAMIDIQSAIGFGTKITIKIPYNESTENKSHLG